MDPERFTAAHRTFPFGTVLRVTDPDNGRSVVVVNDRGPFIDGRVLDLSYGAAKAIDMVQKGVAPVQIEVIQVDQSRLATRWRVQLGSFRDESAAKELADERRCCTARSKSLTSLCRLQSHPAQYVSGIPSAAILLSISHPIRCSTRCLANVRARISGPMIAL